MWNEGNVFHHWRRSTVRDGKRTAQSLRSAVREPRDEGACGGNGSEGETREATDERHAHGKGKKEGPEGKKEVAQRNARHETRQGTDAMPNAVPRKGKRRQDAGNIRLTESGIARDL